MPAEQLLERLMHEYGDTLLRTCYLYLKDYHLAEDAVQETFIKAMRSYDSFEHRSSEKTWLMSIAINCRKNVMRTRWFRTRQGNPENHMNGMSDDPIDDFLEKDSVSAAIMALNADDRQDMTRNDIKGIIDLELRQIELKDDIKNKIRSKSAYRRLSRMWRSIAASVVIAILGGTTVYAGYYVLNKVHVNEEVLAELDSMKIVQMNELEAIPDEYGMINKYYSDYRVIKDELGVKLLDTDLSLDNPYMLCQVMTDAKDFAIITVNNFILGDTGSYQFIEAENRYSYNHGTEYFSPVALTVDLILSESQMSNGWDTDYLGLYEFVESYTSDQGYTVNIVQDTVMEEELENYVSEKVAVFVADGVRYSLKGRVSIDTLKNIVNTMK